uniref:Uncharacterized protein n=1 Tax=Arundo donax TaxID=35708 RepID=A0A0A8ZJ72_ARUDO
MPWCSASGPQVGVRRSGAVVAVGICVGAAAAGAVVLPVVGGVGKAAAPMSSEPAPKSPSKSHCPRLPSDVLERDLPGVAATCAPLSAWPWRGGGRES